MLHCLFFYYKTRKRVFIALRTLLLLLLLSTIAASGFSFCLSGGRLPMKSRTNPTWQPDTSATRHFGSTKLVPKFTPNHRWSCVSSVLSWVEVSRLFLDHSTRVEVSGTTFLVSKCLDIGAEVSQSVLMPKCLVAEESGNFQHLVYDAFRHLGQMRRKGFPWCIVDWALLCRGLQQTKSFSFRWRK